MSKMEKWMASEDWDLDSGGWRRQTDEPVWILVNRPNGQLVSDRLPLLDRLAFVRTASTDLGADDARLLFPPEFAFSPDTGERLTSPFEFTSAPWIPPYGATLGQFLDGRCLRQTTFDFCLTQRARRLPTDDADCSIPVPPRGRYEFVIGQFGSDTDVLIAIEPEKGTLFLWLPISKRWEPFLAEDGGFVSEASTPIPQWRAELLQGGSNMFLCLPTIRGLAIIRPDCLTLSFSVNYFGDGEIVGAPVRWGGEVWAPVNDATNEVVAIVRISSNGEFNGKQVSSVSMPKETFGDPVFDAQQIIWPTKTGQLVVRKSSDGSAVCTWIDWPSEMTPTFKFGSPYLSGIGSFWQLCWSLRKESYFYVQMGRSQADIFPTTTPALSTGTRCYKMATLMKGDPWLEPDDVIDANSTEAFIPILESTKQGSVLSLVMEAESGITALLDSTERRRAVLQIQSNRIADVRFQTLIVSMPWRARAFVFNSCLWIYHSDLQHICGTLLED